MAVYKRSYRAYSGEMTPEWSRFFIVTRHAYRGLFRSRFIMALFVICFFYPIGTALAMYLNHNPTVISLFHVHASRLFDVRGSFFLTFMGIQGGLAFFLTAFTGPGLVSPDLANNALPLYFCRPFSRAEYVLGKMGVLLWLLSLITWVPGLILFGIESSLAGAAWMWDNLHLATGIVLGSLIWILVLSLMSLALSAWVKWKVVAGGLLLGVMFLGSGFAQAINAVLSTNQGHLINPANLVARIWAGMFGIESPIDFPIGEAWVALIVTCLICLDLLARKVRAYEVIH